MIIYHQKNVAAFAGNHRYLWLPQQVIVSRIAVTGAAPPGDDTIAQSRSQHRFVFSRVHGRVN